MLNQICHLKVLELEANGGINEEDEDDCAYVDEQITSTTKHMPEDWLSLFQSQRMHIVNLWDVCQVSIIHRSQFFLLFKGDPADEVYMEVELRRLKWLQEHFSQTTNLNPEAGYEEDESSASLAAR